MDVEIDDGDAGEAFRQGGAGRDGDIGIQAEPHGGVGFGVVPRRPNGAKGAVVLASQYAPHRLGHGTRRPLCRFQAAGRHYRVLIDAAQALGGRGGGKGVDKGRRVHPRQIGARDALGAVFFESLAFQGPQHGGETLRLFGVIDPRLVVQHGAMGVKSGDHEQILSHHRAPSHAC